jgi:hypothetical protein
MERFINMYSFYSSNMTTVDTRNVGKVRNDRIRYCLEDLKKGIDYWILAYEKPVEMNGNHGLYRNVTERNIRENIPQRIAFQINPIKRCLDPSCPPAKKVIDFLERRVETGLNSLPNDFAREQSGEKGVYGKALRNLKRCTTALHKYLAHYVVMD